MLPCKLLNLNHVNRKTTQSYLEVQTPVILIREIYKFCSSKLIFTECHTSIAAVLEGSDKTYTYS